MTHIRTVRDLIDELQAHSLDCEVVIVESPSVSRRIIGVLEKNSVIYLDCSMDNADKMAGFSEVVTDA